MENFKTVLTTAFNILQIRLDVFGYTMTFWQILLFFILAGALLSLFYGITK